MSSKPLTTITEKTGYDDSHDDGESSFVSHDDDDDFVLEMFAAMRLARLQSHQLPICLTNGRVMCLWCRKFNLWLR